MPLVGLKDIAEHANVSVTTASRALSREHMVAPQTRQRILATAQRLGYRPNLLVRGMQTQRTGTVGVLTRDLNDFHAKLVLGIEQAMSEHDYVPIVLSHNGRDPDTELQQIHRLIDRRVDGVIVVTSHEKLSIRRYAEVWDRQLPLVWVGREMPGKRGDQIASDNRQAGRHAAQHLLQLGHTRLAHLGGGLATSAARDRHRGFQAAVIEAFGQPCPCLHSPDFHEGYDAARALLSQTPRPTAVFAANDYIALGLYRAAAGLDLRIPRDLSVVGMADLDFAPLLGPPLTTVSQQARAMGRAAFDQLHQRIHSDDPAGTRRQVLIPTDLVVRQSTSPVSQEEQP